MKDSNIYSTGDRVSHIFNAVKYISYIYSKILLTFLPIDFIVIQREGDWVFPDEKFSDGISKSVNEHIS